MRRFIATLAFALFTLLAGALAAGREDQYLSVSLPSAVLSNFWGQEVALNAHVLLPDSYYKSPARRYPVVYVVHALGGNSDFTVNQALDWQKPMRAEGQEYLIVFLDANFNGLHTLFADSENNGPWATALTQEFIPKTDAYFRTIPDAAHRFLEGHSSGGWAALWLQVRYPQLFGGVWAISPDPVDFHDYTGPDLLAPNANMYHNASGSPYAMWRRNGRDSETMQQFAHDKIGDWQFRLDEAAYSPRGKDGKPVPFFDRRSGNVDAAVAQYWEQHYDIAAVIRDEWPLQAVNLRGKLHVFVGTADTFHLEGSIRLLDDELRTLNADAEIAYAPNADHWTVFDYHGGLLRHIVGEIKMQLTPQ
ncbi:MAG: alpha/beta hydrolase [Candidatus Eremiobacteraeota bacterium]|nr:alpha/beta hydrolase [Candidatus Eremiobacteraeota bacterium]